MKKLSILSLLIFSLGLFSCGPSVCDCKDLLGKSAKKTFERLIDGEKPNLKQEKKTFKACKEKYGDLSPSELVDKLGECGV